MVPSSFVPLAFLLLTPRNPLDISPNSCLSNFYYGTPGTQSIFITDQSCLDDFSKHSLIPSPIVRIQNEENRDVRYIWLEQEAVDESIARPSYEDDLDDLLQWLRRPALYRHENADQDQLILGENVPHYELLHRTPTSALIALNTDLVREADAYLPRYWKLTVLPETPVSYFPVPSHAVKRVRDILKSIKFDPVVASLVNNISVPQMRSDVRYLTGEDPESGIMTRHSFSQGILIAADWIQKTIEATGANCTFKPFLRGFAPNVVCAYPSSVNTTETILLSAHYDSRGSFGSTRAPGANDDGSGTTAILAIARTIARTGITFQKNVQLCLFAGEEQGLYGSRGYARELRAANANLTLMIQADMLAYHVASEPPQLGLPDRIGTPEVTQLIANLSSIYSPELKVGFTPACCSDHQSFHEQGFPASQVYERAGPIADPMYHNSGDLSDRQGYDLEQVKLIAKVQFATLLHSAGYDLPEDAAV